jgi:tight adherence protein B
VPQRRRADGAARPSAREREAPATDHGDDDPPIVIAGVVGLLSSGMSPRAAWAAVGISSVADDGTPELPWSGRSARAVEAACRMSHSTGAPLASVLAHMSDYVAQSIEADARREAAAAGPRLSARVLTALPAVGLGLGAAVDARVVGIVATTPLGWTLVAAAFGMTMLGRAWMRRMMRTAENASREL